MIDITETVGKIEHLFIDGFTGLEQFRKEVEKAGKQFCNNKDVKPQETIIQQQWNTLYIEMQFFYKDILGSTSTVVNATKGLLKALDENLHEDFKIRYREQVRFIWYIKKNRFIVKSIITIDQIVRVNYNMNGDGLVMCNDCFNKSGLEHGLTPDTYTYCQERVLSNKRPICDKCNTIV